MKLRKLSSFEMQWVRSLVLATCTHIFLSLSYLVLSCGDTKEKKIKHWKARVDSLAFIQLNEGFKHPLHRKHLSSSMSVWKYKTVRLDPVPT